MIMAVAIGASIGTILDNSLFAAIIAIAVLGLTIVAILERKTYKKESNLN
jgi:uncharacterized membrane protein YfcA